MRAPFAQSGMKFFEVIQRAIGWLPTLLDIVIRVLPAVRHGAHRSVTNGVFVLQGEFCFPFFLPGPADGVPFCPDSFNSVH